MSGSQCNPGISGNQGCADHLGQGDISRIIGSQVFAQTPYPAQKHIMGIPLEFEREKVVECFLSAHPAYEIRSQMPSDNLNYLQIQ